MADAGAGASTSLPAGNNGSALDLSALTDITTNGNLLNQNISQLIQALGDFSTIVLPVANGGTGNVSFTLNGVLYGNGVSALGVTAQGGANTVLVANAGVPSFSGAVTLATSLTAPALIGTTSTTTPLLIGGSGTTGTQLTLQTTIGVGTTDQFVLKGGNNGGTTFATLSAVGLGVGTTPSAAWLTAGAGTTAKAAMTLTSGTNLTSAAIGAVEFDGVQDYFTIDTTSGRGARSIEQYFHLTSAGSTISTIANYFGSTSNIALVANGYYIIDIVCYFLKSTAGTVTWTFTNSSAPTSQNIDTAFSPIAGIVTGTPTATTLLGNIYNDSTAAKTIVSGTLADAVNHYAKFRIYLQNGSGTNLKIQATASAGTLTPGINSYWFCRRISPNNIGTFAA